jgi:hypothetical protein
LVTAGAELYSKARLKKGDWHLAQSIAKDEAVSGVVAGDDGLLVINRAVGSVSRYWFKVNA